MILILGYYLWMLFLSASSPCSSVAQNWVCVPKSPLSLFNCVVCRKCLFYSFMPKRTPSAVLDGWLPRFKWLLESLGRISSISAKCKLFVDCIKGEI